MFVNSTPHRRFTQSLGLPLSTYEILDFTLEKYGHELSVNGSAPHLFSVEPDGTAMRLWFFNDSIILPQAPVLKIGWPCQACQPILMTLRQTQCHQGFPGFFSSEIFLFFHWWQTPFLRSVADLNRDKAILCATWGVVSTLVVWKHCDSQKINITRI